jgi:flagellin
MGMRIRTNISSLQAQRFAQNNSDALGKSYERLSSGYRINKSADDAAGLAVSENLRAKTRGLYQAKRNANDAVSMLQIAEGGMNEMSNILIRLRELSVQSSSDTIGDTERGFLNREYVQLVDELDRIAKTAEFNGIKFFDTDKPQYVIQVGTNGSKPEDNIDTLTIDMRGIQFNTKSLGFGKGAEIGPVAENGKDAPARDAIAAKLTTIDNALQRVASERATLGAVQNRLGSSISNLGNSIENMSIAKSRISDVDFAEETSSLTQAKILSQASMSVLTQANASQEMALGLLRF